VVSHHEEVERAGELDSLAARGRDLLTSGKPMGILRRPKNTCDGKLRPAYGE
jgi:hypothetical protein